MLFQDQLLSEHCGEIQQSNLIESVSQQNYP